LPRFEQIEAAMTDTSGGAERKNDPRLNDLIAVTVVILTVFLAVCKVKDDNIVQAMQKAQSAAVDAWAEYQSTRVKLHVDENGLAMLRLLESSSAIDKALAAKQAAEYEADIKKYEGRSKETRAKAESLEKEYDRLNSHDDQFDASDAFISIAIALAAVAALVDAWWLLYVAWGSGAIVMIFGAAGFAGIALRSGWLATLLGT
jgi:hypothetical protein